MAEQQSPGPETGELSGQSQELAQELTEQPKILEDESARDAKVEALLDKIPDEARKAEVRAQYEQNKIDFKEAA